MPADYVEIGGGDELREAGTRRKAHGHGRSNGANGRGSSHRSNAMHGEGSRGQYLQVLATMAVVCAVTFNRGGDFASRSAGTKVNPAGLSSLTLMPKERSGPPAPRVSADVVHPTRTTMEETIEFKLPKSAKGGQILHVVVPGQHDLQPVRVPMGAKSGMMLSIKVPAQSSALEEEAEEGGAQDVVGEAGEAGENDIVEEVEEDAELVEEDVEFTWTHFFLLIAFVGAGTVLIFYFVKGAVMGFGPLEVDPRRIVDHPCRHHDKETGARAAEAMERRRKEGGDGDTPNSTPRGTESARGLARSDSPTNVPEKGRSVRQMGAGASFAPKKGAVAQAVDTLKDEGQEIMENAAAEKYQVRLHCCKCPAHAVREPRDATLKRELPAKHAPHTHSSVGEECSLIVSAVSL